MAKFEVTPDVLIRSAHVEEYATRVTKAILSKMVVDSGYDDMEFMAVRYLGYSKSQGATFLAMSYDDNEEEFLVGLVYVNEKGVDFPGVPEFVDEDRRKADAFYSHYGEDGPAPQPVREAGPQRTEDPRLFPGGTRRHVPRNSRSCRSVGSRYLERRDQELCRGPW